MTASRAAIWTHDDWWASGYARGLEDGRRQAEADMAATWAETARRVQALAKDTAAPYDALAERRGEHDRAERQREILRERGVA